jgi:DNA polymerase-3 subunit epsilon
MDDFVVFDLEQATSDGASICEIAFVHFSGGAVTSNFASLVRPATTQSHVFQEPEMSEIAHSIHQIDVIDLKSAPTLLEIWPEIEKYLSRGPLVAHNATQDVKKLIEAFSVFGISMPDSTYFCTMTVARNHEITKSAGSHALEELAQHFDVPLERKLRPNGNVGHGALEDAVATGLVMQKFLISAGGKFENLMAQLGMRSGKIAKGAVAHGNTKNRPAGTNPYWETYTPKEYDLLCERLREASLQLDQHPLHGKSVVISLFLEAMGTKEFWICMAICGAHMKTAISKKVDYLIEGDDPSGKYQKGLTAKSKDARALQTTSAASIEILDESQLLQLIGTEVIDTMFEHATEIM